MVHFHTVTHQDNKAVSITLNAEFIEGENDADYL